MELSLRKFRIKEGKIDDWDNFCQNLVDREDEVQETLRNENVFVESCFRDGEYVYWIVVTKDYKKAITAFRENPFPIDKEAMEKMNELIDTNVDLNKLFHFVNPDATI